MSLHDWVRLASLGAKALEIASRTPKVPMIRRQIIAPDGRKATFVVPADEPRSVSIARMYPGGVVPTEVTQKPAHGVANQGRPRLAVLSSEPQVQGMGPAHFWFYVALTAFAAVLFALGIVSSRSNNGSGIAMPNRQATSVPPAPVQASAPVLPRVQLKIGANVRNGPSRGATVLRVGQQGEVFTKFGEANGWLHVGATQPEGWVAQSVVIPTP